jgi:hypothetical protein
VAADALVVVGGDVAAGGGLAFLTLNTAVCGQYTTQLSHSKHMAAAHAALGFGLGLGFSSSGTSRSSKLLSALSACPA